MSRLDKSRLDGKYRECRSVERKEEALPVGKEEFKTIIIGVFTVP